MYFISVFQVFLDVMKVDWHDYAQILEDEKRSGVGEQGRPASLSQDDSLDEKEALYKVNGFNALLSDKIDLKRFVNLLFHTYLV